MRTGLNQAGSFMGLAFLSLISVATTGRNAAAMPAAVHSQAVHAGATIARKVDTAGDPINGRKLFLANNCYICHGGRGGGGMCPSLRDDRPNQNDVADALLNGKPSGMPSFARLLTNFDIADLAAYIKSMRSGTEPTFTEWWLPPPR
jgi:cytochrome c oxidase cbb3-type subunit 3